jgi:hypothetical protein
MWGVSTVYAVHRENTSIQRSGARASNEGTHCCINTADSVTCTTAHAMYMPQPKDMLANTQLAADRKENTDTRDETAHHKSTSSPPMTFEASTALLSLEETTANCTILQLANSTHTPTHTRCASHALQHGPLPAGEPSLAQLPLHSAPLERKCTRLGLPAGRFALQAIRTIDKGKPTTACPLHLKQCNRQPLQLLLRRTRSRCASPAGRWQSSLGPGRHASS